MKINTISAYLLVYLLARGHWNLMVPVRADDTDGSLTGSRAGSASSGGSMPGSAGGSGSSSGKPRSKAGSSAGSTAGSTAESEVANLSEVTTADPDGSDGSAAPQNGSSGEGASSGGTDAGHASSGEAASLTVSTGADGSVASSENGSGTDADASSSEGTHANAKAESSDGGDDNAKGGSSEGGDGNATPAAKVILSSLFPDYGSSVVEYTEGAYGKALLHAKKADAMQVAEDARKTAQQLVEAAEKIKKEADELAKAAEDATKIEDIEAKMADTVYKVGVERSQASEVAKPPDMMIYTGFPDGHHRLIDHTSLVRLNKLHWWDKSTMHYSGFPDGWHAARFGDADIIIKEAKKFRDEKYANDLEDKKQQIRAKEKEMEDKDKHIALKVDEIARKKVEVDAKLVGLNAKKAEVNEMRDIITELTKKLRDLENEARTLTTDYAAALSKHSLLVVDLRKLEDDKDKLHREHTVLEDDERNIIRDYYVLKERTKHLEGKPTDSDDYVDPRDIFTFTEELGLVEAAEVEVGESVHETLSEEAEASSEPAEAQTADAKEESGEAAPAPEAHVASTPVATPANEQAAPEAKPAEDAAPPAEGTLTVSAEVRLFKTDVNGTEVEMTTADFTKKHVAGDDRYDINDGVKCIKVMYGAHEIWKAGDHGVSEPTQVGFNDTVKAIVVRDTAKNVVYQKEASSENWKHVKTVERKMGSGSSRNAAHSGSSAHTGTSAESAPAPGSLASSSALSGSKLNLAESTGTGVSETSSVASEGETGSGLRGAASE